MYYIGVTFGSTGNTRTPTSGLYLNIHWNSHPKPRLVNVYPSSCTVRKVGLQKRKGDGGAVLFVIFLMGVSAEAAPAMGLKG